MTETLQSHLAPGARSGMYRLGGQAGAKAVARLAKAAGWQFLHLDASEAGDKKAFLSASARGLHFPDWAGHNWDAFEELVNDLSRLPPAPGYVLLLDGLGKLGQRRPEELQMSLDILQTAVANRKKSQESPLVVLVRGAGPAAAHLATLTLEQPQGAQGTATEQQDA
ncbi:MAG: barstar family protein [Bacteroidota bacterium]